MTRVMSGLSRIDKWPRLFIASIVAIGLGGVGLVGRQPAAPALTSIEVMIPMRDGTRLFTQIYTPRLRQGFGAAGSEAEPLPIVFQRTPYGVGRNTPAVVAEALVDLPAVGYVIVMQDIRGRFKSEGQFVMLRQPRDRKDPKAIDESTDTYDTIEWLLKNVPNTNGRVGMVGTSYPAWLAVMGALDPHPALKAIVPMASPADMWIGDDFHHNGAFRLSYGLEYAYMMESSKEMTPTANLIDRYDTYDWYLELGSAGKREPPVFPRVAADLERLRPPSRLRRVLEAAGVCAVAESRHRADVERRRLVGSGGFLRSDQDLRAAREARYQERKLSGRRDPGITAAGRAAPAERWDVSTSAAIPRRITDGT